LQSEVARLQALNEQLHLGIEKKLKEYGLKFEDLGLATAHGAIADERK
jgi:hypothetical protein